MSNSSIRLAATLAVFLAFFVVMLGAYTRLTDAGLGCPDWPGCYGRMVLPGADKALQEAQSQYPDLPIESKKAWTEMAHRYAAGTLALLIFSSLSRYGSSVVRTKICLGIFPWLYLCLWYFRRHWECGLLL